jgi:hypothetical protein
MVTLNGYVTDREMTQAVFQFTAGTGSNLQTTTLTVPLDSSSRSTSMVWGQRLPVASSLFAVIHGDGQYAGGGIGKCDAVQQDRAVGSGDSAL